MTPVQLHQKELANLAWWGISTEKINEEQQSLWETDFKVWDHEYTRFSPSSDVCPEPPHFRCEYRSLEWFQVAEENPYSPQLKQLRRYLYTPNINWRPSHR